MKWWGGLVAAFLLAGCMAPVDPVDEDPEPVGYAWACPPVEARCGTILSSPTVAYQEPVIAVHPHDPATIVVAVNGMGASADPLGLGARILLLVSMDGGRQWTVRTTPSPPSPEPEQLVGPPITGDPSIGFTSDGVFHLVGLVSHSPFIRFDVFHASSTDLGATWDGAGRLTSGHNFDRPWLTVTEDDRLYVSYQVPGKASTVVESQDQGASWQTVWTREMCHPVSPVHLHQGAPYVSCRSFDPVRDQVHISVTNLTSGETEPLPDRKGSWSHLVTPNNGTLGMLWDEDDQTYLSWRIDGTWTPPQTLHPDASPRHRTYAYHTDSDGSLHVLLGPTREHEDCQRARDHERERKVTYVRLGPDPFFGEYDTPVDLQRTDRPIVGFCDDTYGITERAGDLLFAWTVDGTIELHTLLKE